LANIADNAASSPLTALWVSLHYADPTASGDQTSSEITYTSYARVSVARTTSGWPTTTTETISPAAAITFPLSTGGTGGTVLAAFFGIGTASTGAGHLLYSGTCTPNVSCVNGVQPQLTTATTITES
jgi:hypothetical protein